MGNIGGTKDNKKKDGKIEPVFSTLAITDGHAKAFESKVSLPSQEAVDDAKKWVDHNEK